MSIEAMKLALEALEWNLTVIQDYGHKEQIEIQHKAIEFIYQAIAEADKQTRAWFTVDELNAWADEYLRKKAIQEEALRNVQRIGQEIEQEPVAWKTDDIELYVREDKFGPYNIPLYTHPQIEQDWSTQEAALESLREHMARIKELEAQLELMKSEEPVGEVSDHDWSTGLLYRDLEPGTPLYTHPQPKQEPVGRFAKFTDGIWREVTDGSPGQPLYAAPQPKQKIENEESLSKRLHDAGYKRREKLWKKDIEQEPVTWHPIEAMYPQGEQLDIRMGDGSILCDVLPQYDGDLWWGGSGTGEKFIDPKYADVTHWRIHSDTHSQTVTTCSGCGESSTEDGFLATYCLKCCEVVSGKQCDCADKSQCWEPCGELGKSEAHAEVFDFQQTLKPDEGVKT